MSEDLHYSFPPSFTGEGDREAVEGGQSRQSAQLCPLRFASLSTSPVSGGGKART